MNELIWLWTRQATLFSLVKKIFVILLALSMWKVIVIMIHLNTPRENDKRYKKHDTIIKLIKKLGQN